jgi:hypothetical protein
VELRRATAGDADAIIDLHFAAVHHTVPPVYPPEVLDRWSRQPDERRFYCPEFAGASTRSTFTRGSGVEELGGDASVNAGVFYRRAGYEIVERSVFQLGGGIELASVKMKKELITEIVRPR